MTAHSLEPEPMRMPRRLAQLRWIFLAGLVIVVLGAPALLGLALPILPLLATLVLLAVFNGISYWRQTQHEPGATERAMQLCVDLVGLGVVLYLSGGAANPLVSLLLFPVAVAALTLPGWWVAAITVLAIALYSLLMVFFLPLAIADIERATTLHLMGMWLTFVVSAGVAAWFITRMTASLRARDAQLAAVREQGLRDAQVMALGQLAAGAAHELGTPLATMAVLAGELRQDQRLPHDLVADAAMLLKQIQVCKGIINGLTAKAGIARADVLRRMPAAVWLEHLLEYWRTLWPQTSCQLVVAGTGDVPQIGADSTLEQAVINLLNNAGKYAPCALRLELAWDERYLMIRVCDGGPGFPPEVLRSAGAEPLPAVGGGQGIGLWLTRTAVERLGGSLQLDNHVVGGVATLQLPRLPQA